jgi:tRNA(Ile)-lysidine synthase
MLKVKLKIPFDAYVACSGGVDSMAILDFISRHKKPRVAYMHHGTEHGEEALGFVSRYCEAKGLELVVGRLTRDKQPKESPEEFWRLQRYQFLHGLSSAVVMAHHLDDCVEQWIFSSLHGKPGVIPVSNGNVVRPFLLTKKAEMQDWCDRHGVPYLTDPSNGDTRYARNRIRKNIVPEAMLVNPGLHKVVAKKVLEQYNEAHERAT